MGSGVTSVSRGAGGGVVSMVQPIHMQINRAAKTNRKTGIATDHQLSHAGHAERYMETHGAKKPAMYTIATINEMKRINPPYV